MEEIDYTNPQSRNEKILAKIIGKYEGDAEDPQSRIEVLLLELNEYIGQLVESSKESSSTAGVIPDWVVTDEAADTYIKNKPPINAGEGIPSIIEGTNTAATGTNSHAEGSKTKATGENSHAEGTGTEASSKDSHTEGFYTRATSWEAHAEGNQTRAIAQGAHAEGYYTIASGRYSHTEGVSTSAKGEYSHAEGSNSIATGSYSHVFGKNNIEDTEKIYVEIVGNGSSPDEDVRSNARTLDWSGNEWLAGKLTIGVDPSEDMDVVTKKYLEEQIAELQKKIDALTPAEESGGDSTTENES